MWGSPAFGELADQGYHLELGRAFAEAWQAGEFPPTWSATANGGLGSPAFQLYPPLFAFLTAIWMRLIGPNAEAMRFVLFTALIFNLWSIQWAARGWLGGSRAWAAAGLALLTPGATFVALGRGMFPNFLALGWAALAAGAAQRGAFPVLAVAGAGLILTHGPTAYLVALLGLTFARSSARRLSAATAACCALAATAWFWLPMLEIAQQTQSGYLAEAHPYADSLWFRHTSAQTEFEQDWSFLNEFATFIGLAQIALAAVLIKLTRNRTLLVVATWAFLVSIWPFGDWLTALPHYASVQFCWRWQPLLGIACAIAVASLPFRRALCAAPLALFLPLAWPSQQASGSKPDLASNLIEMRPIGANHDRYPPGEPGLVEVVAGDCAMHTVEVQPSRRAYTVEAKTLCHLRLRTYWFPGWRASLDGALVDVRREDGTALQLVEVPPRQRTLEMRYMP